MEGQAPRYDPACGGRGAGQHRPQLVRPVACFMLSPDRLGQRSGKGKPVSDDWTGAIDCDFHPRVPTPAGAQPLHGRALARHGGDARHRHLGDHRLSRQCPADHASRLAPERRRCGPREGRQGDARPLRLRARHLQLPVPGPGLSRREPGGSLRPRRQRLAGGRVARQGRAPAAAPSSCPSSPPSARSRRSSAAPATRASCRC